MHPLIDIYVCVWECICLKQPSASLLLSVSLEIDSCVLERGAVLIFLVNSSLPFNCEVGLFIGSPSLCVL